MLIVRVLAIVAKPALAGGIVLAAAGGGAYAIDRARNDDPTPFETAQSRGQQLVVSEFGQHTDTIAAIDPEDPGARIEIATIDHADSYGIFATLAPDSDAVAYTALPPDTAHPSPDAPAHAAIVDASGDVKLLADDVDLLVPPLWAPDGSAIVVRKSVFRDDGTASYELLFLGRDGSRSTITQWSSAAVFPIAFAPDGSRLYFATLNAGGSDIYSVATDGADETRIAHLTDGIARDWRLSPDGTAIAYSVADPTAEGVRTMLLDVAAGAVTDASASPDADRVEFNPAWRADGRLTVASIKPDGGGDAVALDASGDAETLTHNASTIDLPLGWSPDGATLAVRSVDGARPHDAGESHLEIVRDDGSRERVSDNPDVLVVGWMQ
ncbi:MAG TPA: hypothetical protein VIH21_09210 [Dehalococcoidia bacterium]